MSRWNVNFGSMYVDDARLNSRSSILKPKQIRTSESGRSLTKKNEQNSRLPTPGSAEVRAFLVTEGKGVRVRQEFQ